MHEDDAAAIAAMTRIGCQHIPGLTMEIANPSLGVLRRHFGVFRNAVGLLPRVEDPTLVNVALPILEGQVDAELRAALVRGGMAHTPMSAHLVGRLVPLLWDHKLHLPWTFKPMNLDFAKRLQAMAVRQPLGFDVFYNRICTIQPTGQFVELAAMFPLPVSGSAQGTLPQAVEPGRLQLEAALVVEANVRA